MQKQKWAITPSISAMPLSKKEDGSKFEKAYIKSNNATTSVPNTLIHKQSEYGWAFAW